MGAGGGGSRRFVAPPYPPMYMYHYACMVVVFAMWPAAIFRPGSNILQRYHDVSQSFHLAADRVLILEHD
jgi:hypothetical protein